MNITSYAVNYAHQYGLKALVLVVDLQIIFPKWPSVVPYQGDGSDMAVHRLTPFEAFLKRAAEKSALFGLLDNPSNLSDLLKKKLHINNSTDPKAYTPPTVVGMTAKEWVEAKFKGYSPKELREYESGRSSEISTLLAAISAICKEKGIHFLVVTPYGPYYKVTDEELQKFPQHVFYESAKIYGGMRLGIQKEIETATSAILQSSRKLGFQVLDLSPEIRQISMKSTKDFTSDGIHLSAEGCTHLGAKIGDALAKSGALK